MQNMIQKIYLHGITWLVVVILNLWTEVDFGFLHYLNGGLIFFEK